MRHPSYGPRQRWKEPAVPKRTILPAFRLALWYPPISHVLSPWPCFLSYVALLLVFSALSSCFWPVFSSMALFSALLVSQQQQKNRRGKYPDGSSSFCSCLILCFTRFAPLCAALSVLCVRCSSCLARLFGVALCVRHVCVVCSVRCAGRAMHCAGI